MLAIDGIIKVLQKKTRIYMLYMSVLSRPPLQLLYPAGQQQGVSYTYEEVLEGLALGFCEAPRENSDGSWCYINTVKLEMTVDENRPYYIWLRC